MKTKYIWVISVCLVTVIIFPLIMPVQGYKRPYHVETKTQLSLIAVALEEYRKGNGHYPSSNDGLRILLLPGREYFSTGDAFIDAWGSPFIYLSPVSEKSDDSFFLYSIGPNRIDEQGKEDDIVCCG